MNKFFIITITTFLLCSCGVKGELSLPVESNSAHGNIEDSGK